MHSLCIVGTDTDAGKTIITAGVANYLAQKNIKFSVQKWVSTGDKKNFSIDLSFTINSLDAPENTSITKISNMNIPSNIDYRLLNPFSFKFPASPHLSADLEKIRINPNKIISAFLKLQKQNEFVLVEGVGGILVPINKKTLLIDIIAELNIPVVIVTKNVLGTINHTLLTINALKNYKIPIVGLIFNNFIKEKKTIMEDNIKIIHKFSGIPVLGNVPKIRIKKDLLKTFKPIGKNILRYYERHYK